ncbi:methyltransferase domain-containing protein [Defluviimonas sp. WL0050]|uniref:Methyltransferase domain-containing protein n=1 Tax=Albidovulum litorale TaxID=2984134 RepID=A0ABT2ZJM4_9RHOB|nr:methyltransferase domain-containing protein [Defluviimonas sp. WL0050]MCV2871337.1 methyltransferase domain-containing protein [Defluviimonas sp. WL0050]
MADTTDFEKMEFEGWGNPDIASGYADGFAFATALVAEELANAVSAEPGMQVLDLCTGHGVVAARLVSRGAAVTGLDFSDVMIELASSAVPQARFVRGDAMAMGFPDASFDAVTIGFGVPHFSDPTAGLSEVARVLNPGGNLAFSIWHGKGSDGAFGWLFDAVGRLGDPSVILPDGPDAHLLADSKSAKSIVTSAGFVDVQVSDVNSQLRVESPEALFDVFDKGAVRAASLLGGQSSPQRDAIREDLAARTRKQGKRNGAGYLVPAPSVVVSAVRAGR